MVIPPVIGNPYNGNINLYYQVDDHPLSYTLPVTNSSPLKINGWEMNFLWGWPFSGANCQFQGGYRMIRYITQVHPILQSSVSLFFLLGNRFLFHIGFTFSNTGSAIFFQVRTEGTMAREQVGVGCLMSKVRPSETSNDCRQF